MNDNVRYFAAGYGLTDAETKRQASQLMERLGCSSFANERLETLSGGTRQKLNLILSLLHDPDLIVLDEPYQGFDYESYIAFWGMADDLRLRNKSVLVVSHLIFDRDRLDQVKTLVEGQIESDRVSQ
jgi:ABC-type multidrug transport system ATPase subunit